MSSATPVEDRWRKRRVLATFVDLGIFLTPVAAATTALWAAAGHLHGLSALWRIVVLLVVATAAAFVSERLARRFLPLSALLRLTMVFPDQAPSRFAVARQSGNPRELMARLDAGDDDRATAARNILALVGALAAHDRKTRGHSERVRAYTDLLSEELGLSEPDRDRLRWSALLHDIGKLRVDVKILNKPGKPTTSEWDVLRSHPHHGEELAGQLLPWLGVWGHAIVEHHERVDGAGYPHGLRGDEISLGGRIVSVVDSFETMTAVRAYKKAMSHKAAREQLALCAGSQLDATIVRAFLNVSLPKVLWAMGPVSAVLQLPWASTIQYAGSRAIGLTGVAAAVAAPVLAASVVTAAASPAVGGIVHPHDHSHGHSHSHSTLATGRTASGTKGAPAVGQGSTNGGSLVQGQPDSATSGAPGTNPSQTPTPATSSSGAPGAGDTPPGGTSPTSPVAEPTTPGDPLASILPSAIASLIPTALPSLPVTIPTQLPSLSVTVPTALPSLPVDLPSLPVTLPTALPTIKVTIPKL